MVNSWRCVKYKAWQQRGRMTLTIKMVSTWGIVKYKARLRMTIMKITKYKATLSMMSSIVSSKREVD